MSQKTNPTLIGLFIVVGAALGLAGLLLFSSARLFSPTRECVVYFNDSLNGLNQGAPVKYRGVTIGSVKRVMIHFNQATNDYFMPVIITIEKKLLNERMGDQPDIFNQQTLDRRIQQGLRASLQTESLVTGVLYIEMHTSPGAATPLFHQLNDLYLEIPTEPTQIQQLVQNLSSVDFKSIETNLNFLIGEVSVALSTLHLADINYGITNLLGSANLLVSSPEITNDLAAIHLAVEQYKLLGEKLNQRVDPLMDNLTNSLVEANHALGQIRGAAENIRTLLAPDAPLRNDLDHTLQELAGAVQSISALAEFLKQHPNALIAGRQAAEKTK
jgi:paraquat-inducible protein B